MSHIVHTSSGETLRKRDIVDDLKEFIQRYEFYDDEVHRLWHDYEQLELENIRLQEQNESLLLTLSDFEWLRIRQSAMMKKINRRRYAR